MFETRTNFFVVGVKLQWTESSRRILLGDNTVDETVMLRPVRFQRVWSLYFSWSSFYVHVYMYIYLCICICLIIFILKSDLRRVFFNVISISHGAFIFWEPGRGLESNSGHGYMPACLCVCLTLWTYSSCDGSIPFPWDPVICY